MEGQIPLDESPIKLPKNKNAATGVIIEEVDGRVWLVHPTNQFGGYAASFPKGKIEQGLPLQANAIKETFEESGLKVEITGIVGDSDRSTSITRYYTAKRVGGDSTDMSWESQELAWCQEIN